MKIYLGLAAVGLVVASLAFKPVTAQEVNATGPETAAPATATPQEGAVTWYTLEQAQELAKKEPRKIFIDVYTDWCGWCKVMDKKTFAQPAVAKYMNEHYYPVKLNAEQTSNVIFNGKVYAFNPQRRTHEVALAVTNNQLAGYPTVVILDEKLNTLQSISSYLEAKPFDTILHFFGEDAYKKTPWETYEKEYKGSI